MFYVQFVIVIISVTSSPVRGQSWLSWQQWSSCAADCTSQQVRIRQCRQSFVGAISPQCLGEFHESRSCEASPECNQKEEAYLEPAWLPWANWSPCSASCGGGTRKKFRRCSSQAEDPVCRKTTTQVCNVQSCPRTSTPTDDALYFLPWESWSRCSTTCGGGTRERIRRCAYDSCTRSERESCNRWMCEDEFEEFRPTPSLSFWSTWGQWSACSITCGFSVERRNRRCLIGDCSGQRYEIRPCNFIKCPEETEWSDWSRWSVCSVKCGKGYIKRTRSCKSGQNKCIGTDSDEASCEGTNCEEVSSWKNWTGWSSCSATCGYGNKIRARECSNRNKKCDGRSVDVAKCQIKTCISVQWSRWSSWSRCSATCGTGFRNRNRTCTDDACSGDKTESQKCNEQDCPGWSSWRQWTECFGTCGIQGLRLRTRTCKDGKTCTGSSIDNEKCQKNCSPEPEWMEWESWSTCSASCGEGSRKRSRKCSDETNSCKGQNNESERCNTHKCIEEKNPENFGPFERSGVLPGCRNITGPLNMKIFGNTAPYKLGDIVWFKCAIGYKLSGLDRIVCKSNGDWSGELPVCVGEWSEWGSWDKCSVSCGTGVQERARKCVDNTCAGNGIESRECNKQDCSGKWSSWETWSRCSTSCGEGTRIRKRRCSDKTCRGRSTVTSKCSSARCQPKWSNWKNWSKCSSTCGSGIQRRKKVCNGATSCKGNNNQTRKCSDKPCEEAKWTAWTSWSKCSVTCRTGNRQRTRKCVGGTKKCQGQNTSTEKCNTQGCVAESVLCDQPVKPVNGFVFFRNRNLGQTVRYSCKPGYTLSGIEKRVCRSDRKWSGETPSCTKSEWTKWTSWSRCSVTCGTGNRQRTRKCIGGTKKCNGENTSTEKCKTQKCVAVTTAPPCGELKAPLNVQIIRTHKLKNKVGEVIGFTCRPGFVIKGPKRIACRKNGEWSAQAPSCIESAFCDQPVKPENGFVFFQNRSFGQTVRYSCKSGYKMSGTEKRVCLPNRKWSGEIPSCTKIEICGIAGDVADIFTEKTTGRVIAGDDAKTKAWPWQAMITSNLQNDVKKSFDLLKGGGSVVNEKWILGAAHVFGLHRNPRGKDWKKLIFIILGITTVPKDTDVPEHAQIFAPESVLLHTEYHLLTGFYDYDVAMVKIGARFKAVNGKFVLDATQGEAKISFTDYVRPVCLPCLTDEDKTTITAADELKLFGGNRCSSIGRTIAHSIDNSGKVVVTGYGKTRRKDFFGREISGVLQQGLLKLADAKSCENRTEKIKLILPQARFTERMICTLSGKTHIQVDACQGDSGSPLVQRMVKEDGTYYWMQLGIVSWGFSCAYTDATGLEYPGFYTNLESVMPFVVDCMINH